MSRFDLKIVTGRVATSSPLQIYYWTKFTIRHLLCKNARNVLYFGSRIFKHIELLPKVFKIRVNFTRDLATDYNFELEQTMFRINYNFQLWNVHDFYSICDGCAHTRAPLHAFGTSLRPTFISTLSWVWSFKRVKTNVVKLLTKNNSCDQQQHVAAIRLSSRGGGHRVKPPPKIALSAPEFRRRRGVRRCTARMGLVKEIFMRGKKKEIELVMGR